MMFMIRSARIVFLQAATLLIVFTSGVSLPAQADDTFQFGLAPSLKNVMVRDPEGDSKTKTVGNVLNLVMMQDFRGDGRLFYELYYDSFSIDAGVSEVGQHVERLGTILAYQTRIRATRGWKPWAGVGLNISEDKYSLRHRVDREGFLAQRFPNLERTNYGVVANTTTQWSITKNWTAGVYFSYEHPIESGTRVLSLAAVFLW